MPEEEWKKLMSLVRNLAEKEIQELKADGYNLLINQGEAAQSGVAHRPHVHIIPRWLNDGLKIDPR
jgi:diadenosine tetraphosphate (Ap4A) HIT family hydrolase